MQREPGRRTALRRRSRRRRGGLFALLALAQAWPLGAAELSETTAELTENGLEVSLLLEGAFTEAIEQRLEAGLEVGFDYRVRLRRRRQRFVDKTVAERRVIVTAQFSNLTRMYKLTRQMDGTVVSTELTDQREDMRHWMTRIEALDMFGGRDLEAPGEYYVSAKAKLLRRFRLLFIPADVQTDWRDTDAFVLPVSTEAE